MDGMSRDDNNLRDISRDSIKDTSSMPMQNTGQPLALSWQNSPKYYSKTNRLISALYMVTDTMEKDEPLRLKLRTLGAEILSDINFLSRTKLNDITEKVGGILAFLGVAYDVKMISEMNCNILRKEFMELKQSIDDFSNQNNIWLGEFIKTHSVFSNNVSFNGSNSLSSRTETGGVAENSKGHNTYQKPGLRIGVQKGATLMNALKKVGEQNNNFEQLKGQRRELILKIIKDKPEGISIKDIITAIKNNGQEIGEKTLQRELISMLKDNVLKKTGEKRWSLYFIFQ